MGVEYYLLDGDRKEVFLLGKGPWSEIFAFEVQDGDAAILPADMKAHPCGARLLAFLKGRRVKLGSDAGDIGSVAVPVTLAGSWYADDQARLGTTMHLWPYDHERDGCHFPPR